MQVLIGEIHPFPNARADEEQAAKILEESAEVFCAWQDYDKSVWLAEKSDGPAMKCLASFVDADRDNLLYECADLIMACSNMIAAVDGEPPAPTIRAGCSSARVLVKPMMQRLLERAAEVWGSYDELERADRAANLLEETCNVIARLGVYDFRPYMQECEQRNRERRRYEQAD